MQLSLVFGPGNSAMWASGDFLTVHLRDSSWTLLETLLCSSSQKLCQSSKLGQLSGSPLRGHFPSMPGARCFPIIVSYVLSIFWSIVSGSSLFSVTVSCLEVKIFYYYYFFSFEIYHMNVRAFKTHVCVSRSAVSHSLRPNGLQPTKFLCPWECPAKILENTGVGCYFLLH